MITYAQTIHDGAWPDAESVEVVLEAMEKAVRQRQAGASERVVFGDLAYSCAVNKFDFQEVGMLAYAMLNKYMKDNHASKPV